jgi:hypothetical protein
LLAVVIRVEKDSSPGEFIEDMARLKKVHVPCLARPGGAERSDREKRNERGLFLTEKHRENLLKELRGGGALGKTIQPVCELPVSLSDRVMGHGSRGVR